MNNKYFGKDVRAGSGRTIRMLRERFNLTQSMLGKMVGVSAGYIGQLEKGAVSISDAVATELANKFDGLSKENFTENIPVNWSAVR